MFYGKGEGDSDVLIAVLKQAKRIKKFNWWFMKGCVTNDKKIFKHYGDAFCTVGCTCYSRIGIWCTDLTTSKTHNTYINSSGSFSSYYLTRAKPTLEYRYRNLKCDSSSATMKVKMYSYKIHWYNVLNPSESLEGTTNATGINASNSSTWYGKTYYDIDCSSSADILAKFSWMNLEEIKSV